MKTVIFDAREEEQDFLQDKIKGDVVYVSESLSDETVAMARDAQAISVFVTSTVPRDMIEKMPELQLIAARSTGYDHIDREAAAERDIVVTTVPGYGERTVAEFTFALLLTLSRKIFDAYHQVRESGDMGFTHLRGFDLYRKTLGVIGTGKIGENVIRIAKGFGMEVIAYDAFPKADLAAELNFRYVDLPELLSRSNVVTLHVPLLDETRHMISEAELKQMKDGALLLNTARGELIDTSALIAALESGKLAGAGLDVLEGERDLKEERELVTGEEKIKDMQLLLEGHVLIDMPQVVVTPHIAFYSKEAEEEILRVTAENINSFQKGETPHAVTNE